MPGRAGHQALKSRPILATFGMPLTQLHKADFEHTTGEAKHVLLSHPAASCGQQAVACCLATLTSQHGKGVALLDSCPTATATSAPSTMGAGPVVLPATALCAEATQRSAQRRKRRQQLAAVQPRPRLQHHLPQARQAGAAWPPARALWGSD